MTNEEEIRPFAILTDTTRCVGCEKCVKACRETNNLDPVDVPRRWKKRIDDLSSTRYTTIIRQPGNHFVREQCRHCVEPACVSACLVGALEKTPQGPVIYHRDKCMGCRYCLMACPYGIPRYDWEKPIPYIRKCDMCYDRLYDRLNDRLKEGGVPACVEACEQSGQKATIFGYRDELVDEADRRIRDNPGKYYMDKVFGKTEVGGTLVMYLSDISLDFLSFGQELTDQSLPKLTWAALSKVPPIIVGMGGLMTGLWWIVGRRMKLAEEATRSSMTANEAGQEPCKPTQSVEKGEEK